jgi:predicted nucleic acid-binding protein
MRLVLDSSAALRATQSTAARHELAVHELIGPPLLWSEVHSAVHEARWRRQLDAAGAASMLTAFRELGVSRRRPRRLYEEALVIADELGWAKTYDAEFVALARLERAMVLTADGRFRRGADRTGLVLDPAELPRSGT